MSDDLATERVEKSFFKLISQIIDKLKTEIFVFTIAYFLIMAVVSIFHGQVDKDMIIVTALIYLFAVIAYMYIKENEEKDIQKREKKFEKIKFEVEYPKSYPNPFKLNMNKIIPYSLSFIIKNTTNDQLEATIIVSSISQAVIFPLEKEEITWKRKYIFIPYKEKQRISLDSYITQNISSNSEAKYSFTCWYRPLFAIDNYSYSKKIVLNYRILANSTTNNMKFDSGIRRLDIPIVEIEDKMNELRN